MLAVIVTMCAPTVEPIRHACRDVTMGPDGGTKGILLQESIAYFLYFSRKAYFLRLNICLFKAPLTPMLNFSNSACLP